MTTKPEKLRDATRTTQATLDADECRKANAPRPPHATRANRANAGFTMAETITVVAIIAILAGVAFVALMQLRVTNAQLEVDNAAREIYIAAQNHLSSAQGSQQLRGSITLDKGQKETTSDAGGSDDSAESAYYFIVPDETNLYQQVNSKSSLLGIMLPLGSIDESVRMGGSYVIRYQPSTDKVLDVFYAQTSGFGSYTFEDDDYSALMRTCVGTGDTAKQSRQSFGSGGDGIIGWYGGEGLESSPESIGPIKLSVQNDDVLAVNVGIPTSITNVSGAQVKLHVEGMQSTAEMTVPVYSLTAGTDLYVQDNTLGTIVQAISSYTADDDATTNGSIVNVSELVKYRWYKVVIDDITAANGSFSEFAAAHAKSAQASKFQPGENLAIFAEASTSTMLATTATSPTLETNSLFAGKASTVDIEVKGDGGNTAVKPGLGVQVASLRHLVNLSRVNTETDATGAMWPALANGSSKAGGTSGALGTTYYTAGVVATQLSDLSWDGFWKGAGYASGDSCSLHLPAADGGSETVLDAGLFSPVSPPYPLTYEGSAHWISGISVDGSETAGLFGTLAGASSVKNLALVDFAVHSTDGAAGALAGRVNENCTVSNVLVRTDLATTASAKRIVGTNAGGLIGEVASGCTIEYCAAAVYVNATSNAGGLAGKTESTTTITGSYSGGHTTDGAYNATSYDVTASAGTAGGLVGTLSAALVDACYSTCSVSGDTAGGLIGSSTDLSSISNSYATGLVNPDATQKGAFMGTGTATLSQDAYLGIVNRDTAGNELGPMGGQAAAEIAAIDGDVSTYTDFVKDATAAAAIPYDTELAKRYQGKYRLKTIAQLLGRQAPGTLTTHLQAHYGDWPDLELRVENTRTAG